MLSNFGLCAIHLQSCFVLFFFSFLFETLGPVTFSGEYWNVAFFVWLKQVVNVVKTTNSLSFCVQWFPCQFSFQRLCCMSECAPWTHWCDGCSLIRSSWGTQSQASFPSEFPPHSLTPRSPFPDSSDQEDEIL